MKKGTIRTLEEIIRRSKNKLYSLRTNDAFKNNIKLEGKCYRYKNRAAYDPWYTFMRIMSISKTSPRSVEVILFETKPDGEMKVWNNIKRKISILGDEISEANFNLELRKFRTKINILETKVIEKQIAS